MRFRDRLVEHLERSGVPPPEDEAVDKLETYFELLTRWNAAINLTALPLENPTAETFDRLFTEPLAAARYFPRAARHWFDLGSGGGSPAIPLKASVGAVHVTLVESRERKAAFLREVVRVLEISADVLNKRFEDLEALEPNHGKVDVVTVRAVRPDATMFSAAARLLVPAGRLWIFQSQSQSMDAGGFKLRDTVALVESGRSFLSTYSPA